MWSGVGVVAVGLLAFFLFRPLPEELSDVETFSGMGGGHLAVGEPPPDYNSSPATSGEHSASPTQCGIYSSEVPDSVQLHNLEHGTVVIQYQPNLPPDQIDTITAYARTKQSHILVAPRGDLSDPVVVTSWTRMLRLEFADVETIDLYYENFVFTGLEVGVPCPFAIDESS